METRGIRYAPTSPKNDLDLYVPKSGGPCPLVIWIHGGAWETDARLVGTEGAVSFAVKSRPCLASW